MPDDSTKPERTFRLYDTRISVDARGSKPQRHSRHVMTWNAPDYETFNRLLSVLEGVGFTVGLDPWINGRFPSLNRYHRSGSRPTPHGAILFHAEATPTGCAIEFYQEEVIENRNGGRFDFDKREKMPYLIGKAFEVALRAMRQHLISRGFIEEVKIDSPIPDPLAYFNARWDGEYERRRGTHRFERGPDGWPTARETGCWDRHLPPIEHGSTWYFRDHRGHLKRGRCYGGINGMWMVVYGPGRRDFTQKSRHELFQCSPSATPRRVHPRGEQRLRALLSAAAASEDFERAIVLRDQLKRAA